MTVCVLAALLGTDGARGQTSQEYQLKAEALSNLAQFTEWPTNAFSSSNAPVVIAIFGVDPFGQALDEAVRRGAAQNRPVRIERYLQPTRIDTCHILFIARSESLRLDAVVDRFRTKSVLTVSDIGDAARVHGVMVQFLMDDDQLKLRVNTNALARANLHVSSKLLRAAELIPDRTPP